MKETNFIHSQKNIVTLVKLVLKIMCTFLDISLQLHAVTEYITKIYYILLQNLNDF